MDYQVFIGNLIAQGIDIGLKVLGAIIVWIIGSWLISFTNSMITRGLTDKKVDETLVKYATSAINILLKLILIVAIFSYFGFQTTTIAGLLAGVGLAIGAMWGGMMAHLAAGVFLVFLKPFKVGDFISAGDVTGTVKEIGLFTTTIDTQDNVRTYVGNNKIFSGNIQNFTTNPYRRVELKVQLHQDVDPAQAIKLLKERLALIHNVMTEPAPEVEILKFTLAGPVLAVRPYVHNDHYWQVYFDTNLMIRASFGEANFPSPKYPWLPEAPGK
jgi:small conductance mechanosensitive channel